MRGFKHLFFDHALVKHFGFELPTTPHGVVVADGGLTPQGFPEEQG
jgi:hypothetical protein